MQANPSFRAKMPSCISWMSSTRYKYPADNCCLTNASLFALVAVMKPYQTPWAATYAVDSSWNTWKIMEHVVLSTNPPRIRQFFSLNCNPWHLMAILRLKRYRKMSLMSPWGMHQMCKPKAKAWRDKKKVQQLSVSFGEFSLVLHIDSAEKTSWNCWNCRNANVQGFCPHSVRKEVSREQQPSEPTMQRWFLPSCCQLSLVTWELSFIHQCLAPQDFKHSVISSLIGEPSRTCILGRQQVLDKGQSCCFILAKSKS